MISNKEQKFREEGHVADIVRCSNPTDENFKFTYLDDTNNELTYELKAGRSANWPRYIVSHYVKHMTNKMLEELSVKISVEEKREEVFELLVGEKTERNVSAPRRGRPRGRPKKPKTIDKDSVKGQIITSERTGTE